MKIRIFISALLLGSAAFAQQPDVRLEFMSLYRLRQVTLQPADHSLMRSCDTCAWKPWKGPLRITAESDSFKTGDGVKHRSFRFKDGLRVESPSAPPRSVFTPVEIRASNGRLVLLTDLPMEDYVAQVVQGETSGILPTEALRAVAVAARTYATHFRQRHWANQFDFCDTTHCQFVQQSVIPAVVAAVEQTRGEVLWRNGVALAAYYHKDCGGHTESPAEAWHGSDDNFAGSIADPYCVRTSHAWRSEISRGELGFALKAAGLTVPTGWDRIAVAQRTSSGRARTLLFGVGGLQNGVPVAASSIRFAVGRDYGWASLKSDWYDVSMQGDHVVFIGRGTGHGVGLCQVGASEMARSGKNYREILAFYYPGASISVAATGIQWRKSSAPTLDIYTVDPALSSAVQDVAARALAWAESQTQFRSPQRPAVYEYPTVEVFRNATGEPGWVAASTKGARVRIQPLSVLGTRSEAVLRHEFVHFLLESNAAPDTPLWFREGLAMLIAGSHASPVGEMNLSGIEAVLRSRKDRNETGAAYVAALSTVARLERQYGRQMLLAWLARGIPSAVIAELRADKRSDER